MARLKFSDGVTFETSGEYRIERRRDGLYVVGRGSLCPVESVLEGREFIAELEGRKPDSEGEAP